jgi:predicted ATPase
MALEFAAETLWHRGYPDQALERVRQGLSLAQVLLHPFSFVATLRAVTFVHLFRREGQEAYAQAEVLLTLAREHGFAWWLGVGPSLQGWALVERAAWLDAREQTEAGLMQLEEGLATLRAAEAEVHVPLFLGAVAQGYGQSGQVQEGLRVVTEALAMVEKNEERWTEAELYRLKGELTLQQANPKAKACPEPSRRGKNQKAKLGIGNWEVGSGPLPPPSPNPLSQIPEPESEAEAYFLKAVEIARRQGAKSLELRAVMSLSLLWRQQGKKEEARQILTEIYSWFTEGFDTKDLQEAKVLLDELH